MKLSEIQNKELLAKLEFLKSKKCSFCGASQWILNDRIFELREFNSGNLVIGGSQSAVFPVITAICSDCGNTLFFNALFLKIIDQKQDAKKE